MRRLLLIVLAALAVAPAARAGGPYMLVGAAEDIVLSKDPELAQHRIELAKLAGLDTIRVTAQWGRGQTALPEDAQAELENAVSAATAAEIRIVLSLYPSGSTQTPIAPEDRAAFARYTASIAEGFPDIRDFIVGNEPNLNRFWLPQFGPSGEDAAAVAYVSLLAKSYDALKALSPANEVLGGVLSHAGSDNPAIARQTHSPTQFILDMGQAYRANGRQAPIMDAFSFHPYMLSSNEPPTITHSDTTITIADYPKLVGLLGQAFDGTGQKGSTLPIVYDEFGVESTFASDKAGLYTGAEAPTVHPVDQATQALYYQQALE